MFSLKQDGKEEYADNGWREIMYGYRTARKNRLI
jgi:hypothetical protein